MIGQAKEWERLARLERAVVRSLELLERGLAEEARRELARVAAADREPEVPPRAEFSDTVSDQELERAFEAAEPETDRMLDADRVAQVAMRQADQALEAELAHGDVESAFATESMAELLERQGDAEGAARIRSRLVAAAEPAVEGAPAGRPSRLEVIATLERWLENLRGGVRA